MAAEQGDTLESTGGAQRPAGLRPLAPRPHLFIALECDRPLAGPTRHALADCDEVLLGRGATRSYARDAHARRLAIAIPDPRMSSRHARLVRSGNGWTIADDGSRNGVFVDGDRREQALLSDGTLILLGHTLLSFRVLPADGEPPFDVDGEALAQRPLGLETLQPRLANDLGALERLARSGLPILIEGESGTGKELIARALHQATGRPGPLVAVNCGALPANLVESELFGHARGAFSGAIEARPGLVRAAHEGTLFLDEIGELPLAAQVALLRVLQERQVTAIGSTRPVAVDIAVVSATHRDLVQLIKEERFRGDLYARLAGFRFKLPCLAERREDLAFIVRALLVAHDRVDATFTPAAATALFRHDWPLNVRELEHALRAALALASAAPIDLPHLPEPLRATPVVTAPTDLDPEAMALRDRLTALLTEHAGNIAEVARLMGKGRTQIHRWVKRYGIDVARFR